MSELLRKTRKLEEKWRKEDEAEAAGLSNHPALAPSSWLDALRESWKRRAGKERAEAKRWTGILRDIYEARADLIEEFCAEMESAPNSGTAPKSANAGSELQAP
jgi:hypothetical protein